MIHRENLWIPNFKEMKILVTGGAGFIGTNLIKRLVKENHSVHCLDNYIIGNPNNRQEGCIYHDLDIGEIDSVPASDFDICFHLAALSRIQPSFHNPTETFKVNTLGTESVCEWGRLNNVKIVYAGSSSKWHNPYQSPYAMYKHLGEEICKMYRKTYNLNMDIVRFYNVYGPGEIIDGDWAAVIGLWQRQIRDGNKITIVGDGEQRRDFTHVDDIVDGLIKIGNHDGNHIDAWELGTGTNYSLNEVFNLFKESVDIGCTYLPNQPGNYRETRRENNDAIESLGWTPIDRLKEYIKSLY